MSIVPSPIIDPETAPGAGELWGVSAPFQANRREDVRLTTTWRSTVVAAESESEQRWSLIGRPYRSLQFSLLGVNRQESRTLEGIMLRLAQARNLIPLYPDETETTGTASGTTIPCNTQYRRLFPGAYVLISKFGNQGSRGVQFEVGTIASIADDAITLVSPLGDSYQSGCKVFPLIEAQIHPAISRMTVTDRIVSLEMGLMETVGPSALLPLAERGENVAGFDVYDGLPVFRPRVEWRDGVEWEVSRNLHFSELGLDRVFAAYGNRARHGGTFDIFCESRKAAWDILKFFDSRRGRVYPFWVPMSLDGLKPLGWGPLVVNVVADGPEYDWNFYTDIMIVFSSGIRAYRRIANVTRSSGIDSIRLTSTLLGSGTIVSVIPLAKSRFASDEIVEDWITTETMRTSLKTIEVLEEKSISINVEDPRSGTLCPDWTDCEGALDCDGTSQDDFTTYKTDCAGSVLDPADCTQSNIYPACDLRLPVQITVHFDSERMEVNPDYFPSGDPWDATCLLNMLVRPEGWALYYNESLSTPNDTSGDWHHAEESGATSEATVRRVVWNASRQYQSDGKWYDFEIRLVAEETISNGILGTLYYIAVFSNQSLPDYEDGDPIVGDDPWYKDRPVRKNSGTGFYDCHPHLQFLCHAATYIEVPCISPQSSFNAGYTCNGCSYFGSAGSAYTMTHGGDHCCVAGETQSVLPDFLFLPHEDIDEDLAIRATVSGIDPGECKSYGNDTPITYSYCLDDPLVCANCKEDYCVPDAVFFGAGYMSCEGCSGYEGNATFGVIPQVSCDSTSVLFSGNVVRISREFDGTYSSALVSRSAAFVFASEEWEINGGTGFDVGIGTWGQDSTWEPAGCSGDPNPSVGVKCWLGSEGFILDELLCESFSGGTYTVGFILAPQYVPPQVWIGHNGNCECIEDPPCGTCEGDDAAQGTPPAFSCPETC